MVHAVDTRETGRYKGNNEDLGNCLRPLLEIDLEIHGIGHPKVATVLNNLRKLLGTQVRTARVRGNVLIVPERGTS